MRSKELNEAVRAAKSFIAAANCTEIYVVRSRPMVVEGRDAATVKRRSMDLTHALADLRKS